MVDDKTIKIIYFLFHLVQPWGGSRKTKPSVSSFSCLLSLSSCDVTFLSAASSQINSLLAHSDLGSNSVDVFVALALAHSTSASTTWPPSTFFTAFFLLFFWFWGCFFGFWSVFFGVWVFFWGFLLFLLFLFFPDEWEGWGSSWSPLLSILN